ATSACSTPSVCPAETGCLADRRGARSLLRGMPAPRRSLGCLADRRGARSLLRGRPAPRRSLGSLPDTLERVNERRAAAEPGRAIVLASWASNVIFAVTAVPVAAGVDALDGVAVGVALTLFLVALGVWSYAFVIA